MSNSDEDVEANLSTVFQSVRGSKQYWLLQYESKKSFRFCPFRCYPFQTGTDVPFLSVWNGTSVPFISVSNGMSVPFTVNRFYVVRKRVRAGLAKLAGFTYVRIDMTTSTARAREEQRKRQGALYFLSGPRPPRFAAARQTPG